MVAAAMLGTGTAKHCRLHRTVRKLQPSRFWSNVFTAPAQVASSQVALKLRLISSHHVCKRSGQVTSSMPNTADDVELVSTLISLDVSGGRHHRIVTRQQP